MKWLSLALTAVLAAAVASFAIYTFGWRDDGDPREIERAKAQAFAEEITTTLDPEERARAWIRELVRLAPGLWRADVGNGHCIDIHVNEFRARFGKNTGWAFEGAAYVRCLRGLRPASPP